jgi:hypothetical protein
MTLSERELTVINKALNELDKRYEIMSYTYSTHSECYQKIQELRKEISTIKDRLLFEELTI